MRKRVLQGVIGSLLLGAGPSVVHAVCPGATVQILPDAGDAVLSDGVTNTIMAGSFLAGAEVTVTGSIDETVVFVNAGGARGTATGTGWMLELDGFSIDNDFVLTDTGLGTDTITSLTIDLAPAGTAFDRVATPEPGTEGSSIGLDFECMSRTGSWDLDVTYLDPVRTDEGDPVGDLFTGLRIEFVGSGFGAGDALAFRAEGDSVPVVGSPPVCTGAVTILPDAGSPASAGSLSAISTGASLDGAQVSVTGSIDETVSFLDAGGVRGTATGTGWLLELDGSSLGSDFVLSDTGLGSDTLTSLEIDLGPAGAVFDRDATSRGSTGSAYGQDFVCNAQAGSSNLDVTYLDPVGLSPEAPVGDVFTRLRIDFSGSPFGSGDSLAFRADTDAAEAVVPVPALGPFARIALVLALALAALRRFPAGG